MGTTFPFWEKLRTSQRAVLWKRNLLPTTLPIQYLIVKHNYLETKLVNMLIGKRFRCNAFATLDERLR